MDIKDFKSGCLKQGYKYQYFLPEMVNHDFSWQDSSINALLEEASLHLGELNSFSSLVPDLDRFIIMHIFKEAVVSNRIEGTRTNIEEALNEQNNLDPEKRRRCEKTILNDFGKRAAAGIDLLHLLFSKPIISGTAVQDMLNLSAKAANSLLRTFTEAAILKETTGYRRNRTFIFDEYIRLF